MAAAVARVVSTTASREDAAKVLPEADVRFFRDTGSIGIDSLKKILDFLLNLPIDTERMARKGDIPWLDLALLDLVLLDLVVHFRLHPLPSPKRQPRIVAVNTRAMDKFRFGEEQANISGIAGSVNGTFVAYRLFGKLPRSAARRLEADSAWGNRSKQQLGAEPLVGEMGGDELSCLLRGRARVEENDDGRASATECYAENARLPGQLLQTRQQRAECGAVRLMDAVFERGGEQVVTSEGEGSQQEHGILDVRDSVVAGILRRQHAASFFGRQGLIGNDKQQGPLPFWADSDHLGIRVTRHAGNGETAHPAG